MTLKEAARAIGRAGDVIRKAARQTERRNVSLVKDTAHLYSSGPHSTQDLRKADHPYRRGSGPAAQNGRPGYPPVIINLQSGDFAAGWVEDGPVEGPDGFRGGVHNEDWKATLLEEGTKNMIQRPLPVAVVSEVHTKVIRRRRASLRKGMDDVSKGRV